MMYESLIQDIDNWGGRTMRKVVVHKRLLLLISLITLLLLLPALTLAQEDDGEKTLTHCDPVASRLAETMVVTCEQLLDLLADGYGLGQVMQAVYLVEGTGNLADVEALLQQKQEQDIGWGQLKMAQRLAGEDGDAEEMLRLKQEEGLGWGQIKKIQALMDAGADYDEAIMWMKEGLGWAEIQVLLGVDGGPPPWAGGGKDKVKNDKGNGPPAWSNAGGNGRADKEDKGD